MENINRILSWYYKPKALEFYQDKIIYELIGIKLYKKYLPLTGDTARKWRNLKQIKICNPNRFEELYKYERKTRNYEWRHIIGTFGFIILVFVIDKKLTAFDWIFLFLLNLYINIYPMFLQRYNRIRIIRALHNNKQVNPYDL